MNIEIKYLLIKVEAPLAIKELTSFGKDGYRLGGVIQTGTGVAVTGYQYIFWKEVIK